VKRYYINLAVWLAPPHIHRHCFHFHVLESFYSYPGIEEFHPKANLFDLGLSFRHHLLKLYGPCWVTQFVWDLVGYLDIKLRERLIERYLVVPMPKRPFPPRPEPCLTCPDPDFLETAVLGGVIRAAAQEIYADATGVSASVEHLRKLTPEKLERQLLAGAARGIRELQSMYADSQKQTEQLLGDKANLE